MPGPLTVDDAGGVWFADGRTLLRLGPGGVLRALWILPDAAAATADLPVPADCGTEAPGPVAGLTPIGGFPGEDLIPLDLTGVVAVLPGGWGMVELRTPDGRRVPLGTVTRPVPAAVPDGSGGLWWVADGPYDTVELLHAREGAAPERSLVDLPYVTALIPDLGGGPPLLGTDDGVFRVAGDRVTRLVEGSARGGVVRADGHAFLAVDGGIVELVGDRIVREVINGRGGASRDPVDVQLARGVAPA